jgi:SAM-dependent methyltransferase
MHVAQPLPVHARTPVAEAERIAERYGSFEAILACLRRLSLEDFALVFWSMPHPDFPALSGRLPPMVSDEVQTEWTGASGPWSIASSSWFPRGLNLASVQHLGRPLNGLEVLDVGCGYGRFIRFMYYYTDPANIVGIDAWPDSLAHCVPLPGRFELVADVPESYELTRHVDVAYAFSVLTHLSEEALHAVVAAVRAWVRGLFVATIRPVEFWQAIAHPLADELTARHETQGLAFVPHLTRPNYGETTVSFDYLNSLPGWRVVGYERSLVDPLQISVTLLPR